MIYHYVLQVNVRVQHAIRHLFNNKLYFVALYKLFGCNIFVLIIGYLQFYMVKYKKVDDLVKKFKA